LYYACPVWFSSALNKKCLKSVESLHFRALRLIIRDYRQRISRDEVTEITKRLPPDKWSKFAMLSTFLNMFNTNQPEPLLNDIMTNTYCRSRKPGHMFAYDASKRRIGKQCTKNWIGQALSDMKVPWSDRLLSKDAIRVLLKKTYCV